MYSRPQYGGAGSGQPDAWVTAEPVPGFASDGGPKGVPPAVLGACICSGNCQAAGNQRKQGEGFSVQNPWKAA